MRRAVLLFASLACALTVRGAQAQRTVTGTVFDSLRTNGALAGATVNIIELARFAETDSRGRFHFDSIAPGKYSITFLHPSLDAIDIAAEIVDLDVPEAGPATVQLSTPSSSRLYARLCGEPRPQLAGLVIGRVTDVDSGGPAAGAIITAKWTEFGLEQKAVKREVMRAVTRTNAGGVFVLCGYPTDAEADILAIAGTQSAGPVMIPVTENGVAHVNLQFSKIDTAAVLPIAVLGDTLRQNELVATRSGTAIVSGRVRTPEGQRPGAIRVGVLGSLTDVVADSSGFFRVIGIPAGTRTLAVRTIGLPPVLAVLDLKTGALLDTAITLDPKAQILAARTITGTANFISPISDHSGFTEREKTGVGRYYDEKFVEKNVMTQATSLFSKMGSLSVFRGQIVQRGGNSKTAITGVGGQGGNSNMCAPTIFIDGFEATIAEVQALMQIGQLGAIEVYTWMQAMPPLFDRSGKTGCGSIVVWSRFMRGTMQPPSPKKPR